MPESNIRLDIREDREEIGRWRWVVQSTLPVLDLFQSINTHSTRSNALADFQMVCNTIGWANDITEVPVHGGYTVHPADPDDPAYNKFRAEADQR